MLRAQLIGQVHGSLPNYCLLPKHYVLDVVNDHTLCDHCHCGLRIQRTLIRYPVGILLGEPILRHHIKKCPVCGREYPYEQLNDLVPPHGNYVYDIMIEVGRDRFQHHRQNQETVCSLNLLPHSNRIPNLILSFFFQFLCRF